MNRLLNQKIWTTVFCQQTLQHSYQFLVFHHNSAESLEKYGIMAKKKIAKVDIMSN